MKLQERMEANPTAANNFKELLLKRLSYAVSCSILSHVTLVLLYIVAINFSTQPLLWFGKVFGMLTSFTTWLHLIPFASIIFAQVVICAKDYVFKEPFKLSRFKRFVSFFSSRTFVLGLLHVLIGGVSVWLYLSLTSENYQGIFSKCSDTQWCLREKVFFMILGGLWMGLYYFVKMYVSNKNLIFPVIYQQKLVHFKAQFSLMLKSSAQAAVYPTLSYIVFYRIVGGYLRISFSKMFGLKDLHEAELVTLVMFTFLLNVLYILKMKLMEFFFELFLTEPLEYPVKSVYDNSAPLCDALLLSNMPIIQHLVCLDLYLLSVWSLQRRQVLFTLSQPGGHPHTWNRLVEEVCKLLTDFTEKLNRCTDVILNKIEEEKTPKPIDQSYQPTVIQSPNVAYKSPRPVGMRNLNCVDEQQPEVDDTNVQRRITVSMIMEAVNMVVASKMQTIYLRVMQIPIMRYLFEDLPEVEIQECLRNGQLVVWTIEGLSNVAVASFNEDPYGIVHKDLSVIITNLVTLRLSLEKLNKIPQFSRRGLGFDEFSFKIKNSINSAIKRSLCSICKVFGRHLNDIPLQRDIALQLHCYL